MSHGRNRGAGLSRDWCGRPGTVHEHTFYDNDRLVFRNPALCNVCFAIRNVPGDVIDAFLTADIDFFADIESPLEEAFAERWRENVAVDLRRAK